MKLVLLSLPLVVTLVVTLLGQVTGEENVRARRSAAFSCQAGETLIHTPLEYEYKDCKVIISRSVDVYNTFYREQCQRWQGLSSLPNFISSSYVEECHRFNNGTAQFHSSICCVGATTETKCFTCTNATNQYECVHGGNIETCSSGQVCMTQTKNFPEEKEAFGFQYGECVDETVCQRQLSNNRSTTCRHNIRDAYCTECCTGPFCNYGAKQTELYGYYDDICATGDLCTKGTCVNNRTVTEYGLTCKYTLKCQNGGRRGLDENGVTICFCPISHTGLECEVDAPVCGPTEKVCQNGGTCYDHRGFGSGYRCLCTEHWIGAFCEIPNGPLQCKGSSVYQNITKVYTKVGEKFNQQDCTTIYNENAASKYGSRSLCPAFMKQEGVPQFVHGKHGKMNWVEQYGLYYCSIGDGYFTYQQHQCCPSCYSNPCQNGGWCEQDSEWNTVCKCRYGYEGKFCESKVNVCIISGDPHYRTFDGVNRHYQGTCKLNLVALISTESGLARFSVFGVNEVRGSNTRVSYPKYFQIEYNGFDIRLKRNGEVTVNGVRVYPDQPVSPDFSITKIGNYMRFQAGGIIVDYDGESEAIIRMPESYMGQVNGMCGNYDGNPGNDGVTNQNIRTESHLEIGISWTVDDPEDPMCSTPTEEVDPECDEVTQRLVEQTDYCGLLISETGPFAGCYGANKQAGNDFYESCQYDVCATKDDLPLAKELACGSLSAFASFCESTGVVAAWRIPANCPLACPVGMTYKANAPACHATCQRPDAPEKCTAPDTETCACPNHMVLLNGTCQTPDKCTCPDGRKIGDSWLSANCSILYTCSECGEECPRRKVARVYEESHQCMDDQTCSGDGQCVETCTGTGSWGEWSDWSECTADSIVQTRTRRCDSPLPACAGTYCSGEPYESESCGLSACAADQDPDQCCRCQLDLAERLLAQYTRR